MKILILYILILIPIGVAFSQEIVGFAEKDIFSNGQETLRKYGRGCNKYKGWEIFLENKSLKARQIGYSSIGKYMNEEHNIPKRILKDDPLRIGSSATLKVFNGWIIGRDAGEFGGDLKWYSKRGFKKQVLNGKAHQIAQTELGIFALSGMHHMSSSYGSLNKLEYDWEKKQWKSLEFMKFDDCPFVFTMVNSCFYIVTDSDFLRIDENKNVTYLIRGAFWSNMYPNSIVYYNSNFYIGMRRGYLKVGVSGKNIQKKWFEWEK